MQRLIASTLLVAFSLITPAVLSSQSPPSSGVLPESNGRALTGVRSVDALFVATTWMSMTRNEDATVQRAQAAFELALRRDGLVVDGSAPNYLFCSVSFAQGDGLIFYAWDVQYYAFAFEGVHQLLWEKGGVAVVGSNRFDPESPAKSCSDAFANEWLRWNPRR